MWLPYLSVVWEVRDAERVGVEILVSVGEVDDTPLVRSHSLALADTKL